ncbi:FmdB family zinc ribbon protein [Baaleninema sp.]|uniref:FmdB family zinc ribbon protein n=1 Tax=Baaleninema sp. TaxID=3101197 RepID=UPI003CFEB7DE
MPLYEYRCSSCGEFEAWRTIAERDTPIHCPQCEAVAQRIFSPPMVNLNSGSFRRSSSNPEPRLVKAQRDPTPPRYQPSQSGRPWMVGHSPQRYPSG